MSDKIRIVYIIESFDIGGRERVVLDLCNGLNKNIFDVSLIVLSNDRLSSTKFLDSDVDLYYLNITQNQLRNFNLFFRGFWQLLQILEDLKPDIVHSHIFFIPLFLTSLAIRISNKNILHFRTVHTSGLFYDNQKNLFNKFRLAIEKFSTRIDKTYLISISKIVHNNNIKYFKNLSQDLKLIYNGIDLSKFNKKKHNLSKIDFGFNNDVILIIYIARLDSGKNHNFLIDIWKDIIKEIPNAILCFAGDGVLKEELIKEVEDNNLQNSIIFFGSISNVPELLSISDIAVFPSSFEGFGLVMLEEFAMELPVVASDIEAFREIGADKENCFLVSLQDKELYIKRIIELCKDEELRLNLGKNARKRAEDFDIKKCVTSHEKYYIESLK
jgi:glycosyltransferase involved in cell wall biosynthesis